MAQFETNPMSLPAPRGVLAAVARDAIVERVEAIAARFHLRALTDARPRPLAPADPILKRLDMLMRLADDDRFRATCDWIVLKDGPDRLVWLRERAAALGYEALATRLSPMALP